MKKNMLIVLLVCVSQLTAFAQQPFKFPLTGLLKPTEKQLKRVPHAAAATATGSIPRSYDISDLMPNTGNQLNQGSCAAFSTVYDCLTFLVNDKNHTKPNHNGEIDPDSVFSPKFLYNELKTHHTPPEGDCRTGVLFTDILDALVSKGSPTLRQLPYFGEDGTDCLKPLQPPMIYGLAAKNKILVWEALYYQDIQEVESDVANRLPVMFAMDIDSDFVVKGYLAAQNHQQFIYSYNPKKRYAYHAMIVTGYNMDTGLFKILNSWGKDWGEQGYFYMKFVDFINSKQEAYIAKPNTTTAIEPASLASKSNITNNFDAKNRYQGWFRLGYYKTFPKFNIGVNYINKNIGEVIVSVLSPDKKKLIAKIVLKEDQTKYFYFNKEKINLTFAGIDLDGSTSVQNDILLTIKISKDAIDPIIRQLLNM